MQHISTQYHALSPSTIFHMVMSSCCQNHGYFPPSISTWFILSILVSLEVWVPEPLNVSRLWMQSSASSPEPGHAKVSTFSGPKWVKKGGNLWWIMVNYGELWWIYVICQIENNGWEVKTGENRWKQVKTGENRWKPAPLWFRASMCFSIACCCSCHLDSQSSRCQWLHFCLCPMIPCQRAVQLTKFSPAALWRQHPWHSFCSTWQFRQVMGCFSRSRSVLPWHLLNMNDDTNSALKASVNYPPLRPRSVQKYSWQTKGHLLEEAWQEWLYFTHLEQTVHQAILSVYL